MRGVQGVSSVGERCFMIYVTELVVLPGVDEFVADGFTELLPAVLFVGRPGQHNRDLLYCRVVLDDFRKSLDALRNLPSKLL